MRIATLLPSATEIVCALGLAGDIVGITHECDFPPEIRGRSLIVRGTIDSVRLASAGDPRDGGGDGEDGELERANEREEDFGDFGGAAPDERGRDLGFSCGVAQGYATLGQIGFSERSGYTAIGTVCNVAARLCAEAKDGQILLSQRVNVALKGSVVTEQVGALALKGLTQPVIAFNVPLAASQPVLRVIEGGPQNA